MKNCVLFCFWKLLSQAKTCGFSSCTTTKQLSRDEYVGSYTMHRTFNTYLPYINETVGKYFTTVIRVEVWRRGGKLLTSPNSLHPFNKQTNKQVLLHSTERFYEIYLHHVHCFTTQPAQYLPSSASCDFLYITSHLTSL